MKPNQVEEAIDEIALKQREGCAGAWRRKVLRLVRTRGGFLRAGHEPRRLTEFYFVGEGKSAHCAHFWLSVTRRSLELSVIGERTLSYQLLG